MATNDINSQRPLSPHLDIYKWRITMLTSTLHRLSGVFISFGLILFTLKLMLVASGGAEDFSSSGRLETIVWGFWSLGIYYHLCNGVRHLMWDAGKGLDLPTAEKTAKFALIAPVALTVVTWLFV